jgi:hypothetical protein
MSSSNGVVCDLSAQTGLLEASGTAIGAAKLTAAASDNVAVRKVEFLRVGQVIATDTLSPYELEVAISGTENGRHRYSAKAYAPTNNTAVSDWLGLGHPVLRCCAQVHHKLRT